MKIRCETDTAAGGYLRKSDAVWATCITNAAVTGLSLGDTTYAYAGKALITGVYYLWQTFCRFDLSALPASAAIQSCTLRVYVHTDESDADVTVKAWALTASYETLAAADWDAAATYGIGIGTATGISTDSSGVKYIDFEFTADMLATLSTTSTAYDMRLEITNETVAPTGDAYLKLYGPSHSTYRPYLTIVYRDLREQILAALVTNLDAIDEFSGYNTTPVTVTSTWTPRALLGEESFPVIYIEEADETREAGMSQAEMRVMNVRLIGAVYNATKDNLRTAVNELLRDIEKVIEHDIASARLDLTQVESVNIERVTTPADYLIDDNRAYGFVDVVVTYHHLMNEA